MDSLIVRRVVEKFPYFVFVVASPYVRTEQSLPPAIGYNQPVRRLLGIALLLLFSLPLISPALAITEGSGANLPACCRRNGAHHCMGNMQNSGPGARLAATPQRCPFCPAAVPQARHSDVSLHAASLIFAAIVSHPAGKPQTQARARVALDRSRQKRGPPSSPELL